MHDGQKGGNSSVEFKPIHEHNPRSNRFENLLVVLQAVCFHKYQKSLQHRRIKKTRRTIPLQDIREKWISKESRKNRVSNEQGDEPKWPVKHKDHSTTKMHRSNRRKVATLMYERKLVARERHPLSTVSVYDDQGGYKFNVLRFYIKQLRGTSFWEPGILQIIHNHKSELFIRICLQNWIKHHIYARNSNNGAQLDEPNFSIRMSIF